MGRKITDFNGGVVAPGGAYPYGRVKNRPVGTKVDETMTGDVIQTFMRAGDLSGVTYNGNPDNDTNGYQYARALGLEDWNNDGTIDIFSGATGGGVAYHKWRLVGRTLYWQLSVTGLTIAGSPDSVVIRIPAALKDLGNTFVNTDGYYLVGMYNQYYTVLIGALTNVVGGGPGYDPGIVLGLPGLVPFTNGTANQGLDFAVCVETDRP